ncbi:MAG: GNAT family N-acetyltransferase [Sphingobacteriales bacterium]|nr:MAG: GNAT family N-acetyltransferase [Sphingobacteriales bacterium]
MIKCKRTNSANEDFRRLVQQLDADLAIRNGDKNAFFAQYNKVDNIAHAVVAYVGGTAVGCGAMKEYATDAMEVKRMFVAVQMRGKGIAVAVLAELEQWAKELGYSRCVLETGDKMPEAIRLYQKSGYIRIPNYGQYAGVESSLCFQKRLT